jgi:hypothetical protein
MKSFPLRAMLAIVTTIHPGAAFSDARSPPEPTALESFIAEPVSCSISPKTSHPSAAATPRSPSPQ